MFLSNSCCHQHASAKGHTDCASPCSFDVELLIRSKVNIFRINCLYIFALWHPRCYDGHGVLSQYAPRGRKASKTITQRQ